MTTVLQKPRNNNIYLNWKVFAQDTWKRGILKTLAERGYILCSTDELLQKELKYFKNVFHKTNNYPQ